MFFTTVAMFLLPLGRPRGLPERPFRNLPRDLAADFAPAVAERSCSMAVGTAVVLSFMVSPPFVVVVCLNIWLAPPETASMRRAQAF